MNEINKLILTVLGKKIIENIDPNSPGLYNLYFERETSVSHRVNNRFMLGAIYANNIIVTDVAELKLNLLILLPDRQTV